MKCNPVLVSGKSSHKTEVVPFPGVIICANQMHDTVKLAEHFPELDLESIAFIYGMRNESEMRNLSVRSSLNIFHGYCSTLIMI